MKRKSLLFVILVVVCLTLSSCKVMSTDEYQALVTERDVLAGEKTTLTAEKTSLTGELDAATALNTEKDTTIGDLNNQNKLLGTQIGEFQSMLCVQSWDQAMNKTGIWIVTTNPVIVGGIVFYTQWTKPGLDWDDSIFGTTLLMDDDGAQSFIIDTANDCIIPNPDYFEINQSTGGSSS